MSLSGDNAAREQPVVGMVLLLLLLAVDINKLHKAKVRQLNVYMRQWEAEYESELSSLFFVPS